MANKQLQQLSYHLEEFNWLKAKQFDLEISLDALTANSAFQQQN